MSSMTSNKLEVMLSEARSRRDQARGQVHLLQVNLDEKKAAKERAEADIELWRQVQLLLAKVSDYAREQLKKRIEDTVTAALQAVFGDDSLRFQVMLRQLGGQPAAEWEVVSRYGDAEIANSPEESRGGGITDVVSLALRLALLELYRPKNTGLLILDEPAKMVSAQYAPNLAFFLKQYAQRTGRQILLVTHNPALAEAADVAYEVTQRAGKSEVTRL